MSKLEQPSASPSDDRGGNPYVPPSTDALIAWLRTTSSSFVGPTRCNLHDVADRLESLAALGANAGSSPASDATPRDGDGSGTLSGTIRAAASAIVTAPDGMVTRSQAEKILRPFFNGAHHIGVESERAQAAAADRVERDERAGGGERERVELQRRAFASGVHWFYGQPEIDRSLCHLLDLGDDKAKELYPMPKVRRPLRVRLSDGTLWSYEPDPWRCHFHRHDCGSGAVRYTLREISARITTASDHAALARILSGEMEEVDADSADSSSVARGDQ